MLFGKMFAEVTAETGEGDNQFTKWETYFFFVLFIGFNLGIYLHSTARCNHAFSPQGWNTGVRKLSTSSVPCIVCRCFKYL